MSKRRGGKTKLTASIDKDVLSDAKRKSAEKRIPISRLIENFLAFFNAPYVYCFKCGGKFEVEEAAVCPKCGWLICSHCKMCRCGLSEDAAVVAFYMRKVYEDLLGGRLK